MASDKLRTYVLEIILIVVSLFILSLSDNLSRILMTVFLPIFFFFCTFFLKKEKVSSIYEGRVVHFTFVSGLLYLVGLYIMGIFFGFEKVHIFSFETIFSFFIPLVIIHIFAEKIRYILISQKGKWSSFLSFIGLFIIYIFIYRVYSIYTLQNGFISEIGLGVFSSFAFNWLFHFLSKHYGEKPVFVYGMITMMYPFVIPVVPRPPVLFFAIYNLFFPYFVYFFIEGAYSKDNGITAYHNRRKASIQTGLVVFLSALIVCLVSCKFHYGMLVIGSQSMKNALQKGDAIIFEKYKNQTIHEGDIIVFKHDDLSIVHRVVNIRKINGNIRYYTKGDANEEIDSFYALESNIEGVFLFSIPTIGKPTLWLYGK